MFFYKREDLAIATSLRQGFLPKVDLSMIFYPCKGTLFLNDFFQISQRPSLESLLCPSEDLNQSSASKN